MMFDRNHTEHDHNTEDGADDGEAPEASDAVPAYHGHFSQWNREFQEIQQALWDSLPSNTSKVVLDVLKPLFTGPSKLIRPILVILVSRLLGNRMGDGSKDVLKMAVICEYIHVASLLHDDVVDQGKTRRGSLSAHEVWDNKISVLVGDFVYARACDLIAELQRPTVLRHFSYAIRMMSEGEITQLSLQYSMPLMDDYLQQVISHKTGTFFAVSAVVPQALLMEKELTNTNYKKNERDQNALWRYGSFLGYAFQLVDDALDYAGTDLVLGKSVLKDLNEGKITTPVLLLQETDAFRTPEGELFVEQLQKRELSSQSKDWLLAQIRKHKTVEKTMTMADGFIDAALESLCYQFPDSQPRRDLEGLAKMLSQRTR